MSVVGGGGAGVVIGAGGVNARVINCGIGIVNSGRWVRIIINVVAIYIGIAANIKIPNTKPPKPCRWECAMRTHAADENMSKLNSIDNIIFMTSI